MQRLSGRLAADSIGLAIGLLTLAVLLAADILLDQESAAIAGSYVAAPLLTALMAGPAAVAGVGGLAVALAIASPAWNPSSEEAEQIVRVGIIALGTGFAIAAARFRRRSLGRSERLALLDSVGAVADGSLPLGETLHRVTDVIVPAFGDVCMVDAVAEGRATRIAARAAGRGDAHEVEERMMARPPSLPRWLVTGERSWRHIPRWWPRMRDEDLRRISHSEDDYEFLRSLGVSSAIIVPIRARDRNLGALTLIAAWSGRRYDENDVRFAEILASRIGLALDNSGLFSDLESIERRMDTVMAIIDEAVVIHGADGELVFANPAAARRMGFASSQEALSTPTDRIRERFRITDETGQELGAEALSGRRALSGEMTEPLTMRVTERETGKEQWYRTRARPILDSAGRILYSVTVIEDVSDVKRTEFAQRILGRTGELLAHGIEYGKTLEDVAELLVPEFADWCAVNTLDRDGTINPVANFHRDPDRRQYLRELRQRYTVQTDSPGILPEAVRTQEPILRQLEPESLPEVASNQDHLELLRELDAASTLIVPMLVAGRVVGALNFVNDSSSRRFNEQDLEIATEVARRAGVAIENARISDERARLADVLQRELLPPRLPTIPGWEIEAMYEPAGELNEVGGDFYEAFRVLDGWAIVLGDVSGHGAAAASLTAEARHTIRSAGQVASDPCAGLHMLNRNLHERDDAALCSAVLLVLSDATDGSCEATIYLAGHPHPLLVRGEEVEELGRPGPALGVVESPIWEPAKAIVYPNDQLILYTDGVTEARRSRVEERFGNERLREHVAGSARPEETIARIRAALERYRPEQPDDDAALVAIRRAEPGAEPVAELTDAGAAAPLG